MRTRILFVAVFVLCLLFVSGSCNVQAAAGMVVVPDYFSTIQQAIDHASDGDTVFVKSGVYYEAVVIEKSVLLVGEDAATTLIDCSNESVSHVVKVSANNVTITGFTIQKSSGAKYSNRAGVYVEACSGANITNNSITENYGNGVHLSNVSNSIICKNNITNNFVCGVKIEKSSNITIQENVIENNFEGINVDQANTITIQENTVKQSGNNGIAVNYSADDTVSGNTVLDSVNFGLEIYSSSGILASNNVVSNSTKGIRLANSEKIEVCQNNITNNQHGIDLSGASNNIVSENLIANNDVGLILTSINPINNTVWSNDFVENNQQVLDEASESQTVWNNETAGNYWSNYNCTDANADGIGDTAYVIDENNQDNYPLMEPAIIPEFPSWLVLPIFVLVSAFVLVLRASKNEK
jgi:nitrous oxidase accessory protein